jgi:D-alanyl-D-alanine carboxypeptidase-like protein
MGKSLTELASYMQPLAQQLLDSCELAGIHCIIEDTGRTLSEQQVKLNQGTSLTQHSKHLPQPPEMKSEAIDIAPEVLISTKYWSPSSPLWLRIGAIGENLGLFWGGRWTHMNNGFGDPGHFQYIHK